MAKIDTEKFRLRYFVENLNKRGEVDEITEHVQLYEIASIIEKNPKVVWFKNVGPDHLELAANVNGSRERIAFALNVDSKNLVSEYRKRLLNPQPVINVSATEAPVQEVVLTGDRADLTKLPFYLQHELDGSLYISSAIDFTIDPENGSTNVGCRRLSLRNAKEAGTNLTAPSDLKRIYSQASERGEKLPISFAIGSHPVDYLAGMMRIPADEIGLVSTLRGEALPLVKSVTNEVRVPADAEVVLEGYLDERGYVEPDGPYGEYVGFYGPMHQDPVFHVTAITMRHDALHQTIFHGSAPQIQRAESVNLISVGLEAKALNILEKVGIDVKDVYVPLASAEGQHLRVSISARKSKDAKKAIKELIDNMFVSKHVFVVDDDIDIRNENQWEWAFVSRFQADRDMITYPKRLGMPMDPSLYAGLLGTKAGFDLTLPLDKKKDLLMRQATAPTFSAAKEFETVREALTERGPLFLAEIMSVVGSFDGREVMLELDEIRQKGKLLRDGDGRYLLGNATKGETGLFGPQHKDPNSST